ncbi:hypothetical protein [Methyloglobulus sp.]
MNIVKIFVGIKSCRAEADRRSATKQTQQSSFVETRKRFRLAG